MGNKGGSILAKLNREFWAFPVFAGIAFAYASWLQKPVLWFLVYLCLVCMALALLYRRRNWRQISVVRSFYTNQSAITAGSDVKIQLRIETSSLLPWPWVQLRDSLPRPLEKNLLGESGGSSVWARRGTRQYITYTIKDIPRGIYTWERVQINSGDPLGLVSYQGRIMMASKLVVYPRTVEMQALHFFPRRQEGTISAKKSLSHDLSQLVGIRDYRPGDRLSLIHWKATAKTNKLQTKEFAPLLIDSSLIVLDCTADAWKRGFDPAFEEAVTVAASLVKAAWLQRIPVRFYSNEGRQPEHLAVASQGEFHRLLLHLAATAPTGRQSLSQFLLGELFFQGSNVVLVSSAKGEKFQQLLYRLASRGNSVTLIQVNAQGLRSRHQRPRAGGTFNVFSINKAEELAGRMGKREVK